MVKLLLWSLNVKGGKKEGMMMEWSEVREERPVKMEEGREERLL